MRFPWLRQGLILLGTVGAIASLPAVNVRAVGRGAMFQATPARQSEWDGVYTDDQAARGEAHYARSCESCHGADLSGNPVDEIPALAWDAFLMHWNDKTIKDLFDSIKRS